jgi:hypothetical protein
MTNQERAAEIAASLHKVERALAKHHALLAKHADECACDLGIDVAPLSAGGEKPPRPQ